MHGEPAELNIDILACCQLPHVFLPEGEDFVAPAGIDADSDRRAYMVKDHRRFGEGSGKVGKFRNLRVIQIAVEGQAMRLQSGKAGPEPFVEQH